MCPFTYTCLSNGGRTGRGSARLGAARIGAGSAPVPAGATARLELRPHVGDQAVPLGDFSGAKAEQGRVGRNGMLGNMHPMIATRRGGRRIGHLPFGDCKPKIGKPHQCQGQPDQAQFEKAERRPTLLFDGNRALAAESLGLPKRTLAHKCRQLELDAK